MKTERDNEITENEIISYKYVVKDTLYVIQDKRETLEFSPYYHLCRRNGCYISDHLSNDFRSTILRFNNTRKLEEIIQYVNQNAIGKIENMKNKTDIREVKDNYICYGCHQHLIGLYYENRDMVIVEMIKAMDTRVIITNLIKQNLFDLEPPSPSPSPSPPPPPPRNLLK
jgi:hypothetical protein